METLTNGTTKKFRFLMAEFPEFVRNTELGLCLLNRHFEILWANKVQRKWFGPLRTICGKHCYEIFEHNPRICDGCPVLETFKTGKPYHSELRTGYTKTGKVRFYELSTAPIKDKAGRVEEVLEIARDITDRKLLDDAKRKAEKALAEKTKRLKLLGKRLWRKNKYAREDAVKAREMNTKIEKVNQSLEKMVAERTKELELANIGMTTLFGLGKKMVSTLNLDEVLDTIVKTVPMIMDTDGCVVRLLDEAKKQLVLRALSGLSDAYYDKCKFMKITPAHMDILKRKSPFVIADLADDETSTQIKCSMMREGMRSLVGAPVIFNDEILGVVIAISRRQRSFLDNEANLLQAFASSAAIAIKNAKLHENVHMNYYNTIKTLSLAMEARDPYTRGHAERVTNYATALAKILNMSQEEIDTLRYCGKIHDIGKIAISDIILLKPGKLTPSEKAEVELHPIKGVEIISNLKFLEVGIPIIRHHHERYDGGGYPDGLKKDAIPMGARILAVADAFDAMTSERPYRSALAFEEAIDELKSNSGRQFDPQMVGAFIEILTRKIPA